MSVFRQKQHHENRNRQKLVKSLNFKFHIMTHSVISFPTYLPPIKKSMTLKPPNLAACPVFIITCFKIYNRIILKKSEEIISTLSMKFVLILGSSKHLCPLWIVRPERLWFKWTRAECLPDLTEELQHCLQIIKCWIIQLLEDLF